MKVILAILAIVAIFIGAKKLMCTPDYSIKKVSIPIAEAIQSHLEKYGVPDSIKEIENFPYTLNECKKIDKGDVASGHYVETCVFLYDDINYFIKFKYLLDDYSSNININMVLRNNASEAFHSFFYWFNKKIWNKKEYLNAHIRKLNRSWICNPKLFRLTD